MDAEAIGHDVPGLCPQCGKAEGRKLSKEDLLHIAHRFFVWGSLSRVKYGGAPLIQFNTKQQTNIDPSPWLRSDIQIFEKLLGVGFFLYGPRLWMVGEIEPLKALQGVSTRTDVVNRILREYPTRSIEPNYNFYRIRKEPKEPAEFGEYDSPPIGIEGSGRLDTSENPVLYASPDLQVCVHECRVTAEDEIFVATLTPTHVLQLLDLSSLLPEHVTEFESLDLAVHMLFLAGKHSYEISREIARAARSEGFDGIIYPSYFSLLRNGVMPFPAIYGISTRLIPQLQVYEEQCAVPNLGIFGRPVHDGKVEVKCINKLILSRVTYEFHFGPVTF